MIGLTRKQAELLSYIETYMAVEPVAPSFEEMKAAIGIKSKSGVHRLLDALAERGYIHRIKNRARCLTVTRQALAEYSDAELRAELDRRRYERTPLPRLSAIA